MKNKIREFLASGLKPAEVADIVGCSPSYISQLLKDTDFKESVEAMMKENPVEEDKRLDMKYEAVEFRILDQMSAAVVGAELPHLSSALREVVKARDIRFSQKNPVLAAAKNMGNVQIVQVMLPQHAIPQAPQLTLNEKSEVIAIGERPLAPMSSAAVKNLFNKLDTKPKEIVDVSQEIATLKASSTPQIAADF